MRAKRSRNSYTEDITPYSPYRKSGERRQPAIYAYAGASSSVPKYGDATDFAFDNKFALILMNGFESHSSSTRARKNVLFGDAVHPLKIYFLFKRKIYFERTHAIPSTFFRFLSQRRAA